MLYICKEIQDLLTESGKTLCTAESCSGGRIAALLTSVAGSSEYFRGGIVSYQTEVKSAVLQVPPHIINIYGVVSHETADAMRSCACRLFQADYAISITGYAGPTGGTADDPVGTVYISVGTQDDGETHRVIGNGQCRTEIQDDVAHCALQLFLNYIRRRNGISAADTD